MSHDVFISYSSNDKPTADAITASLEANGIRCWIAPRDILPGSDWSESIVEAIEQAGTMVLVFSAHSNTSPQIKREIERAVDAGIPLIPFRIEDVLPCKSLQYFIGTQHWLDAWAPPLEQHLHRLTDTIKALLSKRIEGFDAAGKEPRLKPQSDAAVAVPTLESAELPLSAAGEEPLAGFPKSTPARKFPWAVAFILIGLLVATALGGGVVWWRWSQPVVSTPKAPAPLPPTAEPSVRPSATEYYNMGNEAKDPEQKIGFYTKAIEINPYNAQYYYFRGLAYKARSLFPLAIEDFGKAINYQPNYPSAYIGRGDGYYEMGQYDWAITDYTKALSLEPSDPFTHVKRGHAFFKKGENERAIADYNEAIKLQPNYATAFYSRGVVYSRRGENEKALADYNEAIKLDPKYVLAYKDRAALYEKMGDQERATDDHNKANLLDPKDRIRSFRGKPQRVLKPE